jgi:hypothetical protein
MIYKISSIYELGHYTECSDGQHIRLDCPYCVSVRGVVDDDQKLYINTFKGVGMCFKCESIVILEDVIPSLDKIANIIEETFNYRDPAKPPSFNMEFTTPIRDNPVVYSYLKGRNHPVSEECIDYWEFKACTIGDSNYVFIPNKVEGSNTDYYMTRIADKNAPKESRWDSARTFKPLFKIHKFVPRDDLFFVEGVFSATAIGVNAIPLLGKFISDYQMNRLGSKFQDLERYPKRVFVVLDGGEHEKKVAGVICDRLRKIFTLRSEIYRIDLPAGMDPDDVPNIYDFVNKAVLMTRVEWGKEFTKACKQQKRRGGIKSGRPCRTS